MIKNTKPHDEVAGGGEQPLGQKLPDNFEVTYSPSGQTWKLTGGIVLHRLVVEDPAQLERRKEEINDAIINSNCLFTDDDYTEVSQVALPQDSIAVSIFGWSKVQVITK